MTYAKSFNPALLSEPESVKREEVYASLKLKEKERVFYFSLAAISRYNTSTETHISPPFSGAR